MTNDDIDPHQALFDLRAELAQVARERDQLRRELERCEAELKLCIEDSCNLWLMGARLMSAVAEGKR